MHFFQEMDEGILLFFQSIHNDELDYFFWHVSEALIFLPLWIFALIRVIKEYNKTEYIKILVIIVLSIFLSDQISNVFKNTIKRERPTHNEKYYDKIKLVNNYKGGKYGFYSAHASNSAAIAVLTLLLIKKSRWKYIIILYPLLSGISRMYLGVHYFSDVLVGWIMGSMIAIFVYWLINKWWVLNKHQ
ncbi:MAG TPA: phosphatase PAP2 family protein [Bacteroidia bacterium]|nr:phosphatase PAP2 family protein [Bacteroidia bacterium]